MPEDAMNERQTRLHGNEDSLDDVEALVTNGQNGHHGEDLETGNPSKVKPWRAFHAAYSGLAYFLAPYGSQFHDTSAHNGERAKRAAVDQLVIQD